MQGTQHDDEHAATPGAVNQMQRISDEEMKTFQEAFSFFDNDGSGVIDIIELRLLLRTIGIGCSDNELDDLITAIDVDCSHQIEMAVDLPTHHSQCRTICALRDTHDRSTFSGICRVDDQIS